MVINEYMILALLCMLFLHVLDDFHFQGCLSNLKQKEWWKQNAPEKMYRFDYIAALIVHSFSWTFLIMLVPMIYSILFNKILSVPLLLFISNMIIHGVVDDLKANEKRINLITDQVTHIVQIVLTWLAIVVL